MVQPRFYDIFFSFHNSLLINAHLALNAHYVHKTSESRRIQFSSGHMAIAYVYPNTADIPQRGGLDERVKLAESAGCSFIEVPADLIKNGTEIALSGQSLCSFLNKESITALYRKSGESSRKIPYILHTEPSLGRSDGFGIRIQAPLKWYDNAWVSSFIQMIIDISDFFDSPADKIEIHPRGSA